MPKASEQQSSSINHKRIPNHEGENLSYYSSSAQLSLPPGRSKGREKEELETREARSDRYLFERAGAISLYP